MPSARRTPLAALALVVGCATPDPLAEPTAPVTASTHSSAQRSQPPARSQAPARDSTSTPPERRASAPTRDPFAEGFLSAHNRVRASVSPPADPPLPELRWSPELAATAQAWAQRCKFEHSETTFGENLSARTNRAEPATIVSAWASEAANYDYARNRCAKGEVCGHYTQLAWRDTSKVGCGVAQCSDGGPFGGGQWFMWVCNYDPPGNWKGERPY